LLDEIEDFVSYVVKNYRGARKIVEVGIGRFRSVALEISERLPNADLVVVDNDPKVIAEVKGCCPSLKAVLNDVMRPTTKVYDGADLIYSIRCPPELLPCLTKLADDVQADLIILPLHEDAPSVGEFQPVTFGGVRFYLKRRRA
jgi:hypothetical protein